MGLQRNHATNWGEENTVNLSTSAEAALRTWIGGVAWDSHHPADEGRFYDFVHALWEMQRGHVDEVALRERIVQELKTDDRGCRGAASEETVREYVHRATDILLYLAQTQAKR
jgi:hypothetical protein